MLRKISFIVFFFTVLVSIAVGQDGKISGRVYDDKGNPVQYPTVSLLRGEEVVNGAYGDDQGFYSIQPVDPGTYTVQADILGGTIKIENVSVASGQTRDLDIRLPSGQQMRTDSVIIVSFRIPVFEKDPGAQGTIVDGKQVRNRGSRNINAIASTTPGVFQSDEGDNSLSFRGAREGGTMYIVDGVKVRGSPNLPQSAIGQMQIITGGTPSEYGDFTGGVVSITTANPANKLSGGLELVTSELLDAYGRNLAGVNITGPLIKKTITDPERPELSYKRSVVGFFLSGEYDYNRDADPAYFGLYKLDPDKLADLQANPMIYNPSLTTFVNTGNYLKGSDLIPVKAKAYNQDVNIRGLARIDIQPADNISIKLGGSAELFNSNAGTWSLRNMLLSPNPGGRYTGGSYRAYARFQQSFKGEANAALKNFFYTLQADYSLFQRQFEHRTFQDNLWDYGFIGKLTYDRNPVFRYIADPMGSPYSSGPYWENVGYGFSNLQFDGTGTNNQVLANANRYIFDYVANNGIFLPDFGVTINDLSNPNLLSFFNGYRNGDGPDQIYQMFTGLGAQYGTYRNRKQEQFRLTGQATAEIKRHNLKIGFEFEQRVERDYNLGASAMWNYARLYANRQLQGVNRDNPTFVTRDGEFQDTIIYPIAYDAALQTQFDKKLREALGQPMDGTNWINTDALDPQFFNSKPLGYWFTASEMLNNGQGFLGGYYGYTYDGKIAKRVDPAQFFTDTLNRPQNAFSPTYISAFIQDKFELEDIIFNLGVRVDRFDANQQVLKDNYLLYPAYSAAEAANRVGASLPSSVSADYIPYVDDIQNPTRIIGYRTGETWFDANGAPTSSSAIAAASGGKPLPYVKRTDNEPVGIDAFQDYAPQTVVMPRMSFSFPIAENALFFAHYDVLAQRPGQLLSNQSSFLAGQLSDYLYLRTNPTIDIINPNLKPEITTDYEAGFRQKIGTNSAISLSAYYREMRNMIQYRRYNNAYPITYNSYDNIDFGTVKGFSLSYNMRRIKQLELSASYTLQFATATGSDFSSSRGVTDNLQGTALLRTLLPVGTDQRHRITASLDYRFGEEFEGATKGPGIKIGEKVFYPFANAGANATFILGSGTPYSRQLGVTSILDGQVTGGQTLGTPNSNRLPWQFRTDLRIDKNLVFGGKPKAGSDEPGRGYTMNIYLLALNAFNTQNITGVYRFTGLPFDDGFLQSPQGAQSIQSQINPESFVDLYQARLRNPNNVAMPRRIRLGMIFSF
ncbi:MAG: TonB-dependent receptor [Bacteroidia bacterium]|nr:TonB-dependent receptor [Bacteroidia bacterium]